MKSPFFLIPLFLMVPAVDAALIRPAPQTAAEPLSVAKIGAGVYLLKGGAGANTGFVVGDASITAIDVKMTPAAAGEMLAAIRKVSPLPVATIVLTHSDRDHVDGFPGFPKGLKIIAQKNCLEEIKAAAADQPFLNDYLPTVTFGDRLEAGSGPLGLELRHFGPAHTSGDAVVIIPGAKIAFVGDLVFLGREPLIHRRKNGRSEGLIRTLAALLAYKPEIEVFLPGHGDAAGRNDIEGLIDSLKRKRDRIAGLVAAGKSLEDVKKELGVVDPPAGRMRFPGLTEVMYLELTEKTK